MWVYAHTRNGTHGMSEDNLQEFGFSFHHGSSRHQTQGCQIWQREPLPTEPPPLALFFLFPFLPSVGNWTLVNIRWGVYHQVTVSAPYPYYVSIHHLEIESVGGKTCMLSHTQHAGGGDRKTAISMRSSWVIEQAPFSREKYLRFVYKWYARKHGNVGWDKNR